MKHHIVYRTGSDDNYAPSIGDGGALCVLAANVSDEDVTSIRSNAGHVFEQESLTLRPTAEDLLNLALATYGADLTVRRATGYDTWTRNFALHLPVVDAALWRSNSETVVEMLSFLTGDHWELILRERDLSSTEDEDVTEKEENSFRPDAVSLFSGGLDSFIGAIEYLDAGSKLALVGHYGAGSTNQAQEHAFAAVNKGYEGQASSLRFYVQPQMPEVGEPEKTTRSRSILFLALGTAVATGYDEPLPLHVPENGLISLNPPLTDSLMGTLSTRTTHPHFMELFRTLVLALGLGVTVETPYRFLTKGEMAKKMKGNKAFDAGVYQTVSCSHPDVGRYQGASPGQHCGYCVPCIIRRAALIEAGLDFPSHYLKDILSDRPAQGSDTNRDLRAFEMSFIKYDPKDTERHLFEVLSTGPIPSDSVEQFVDVYRRGMAEVGRFLEKVN